MTHALAPSSHLHPRQEDALRATQERASLCGVTDLVPLSGAEAMEMEPNLRASAALLSPTTGERALKYAPSENGDANGMKTQGHRPCGGCWDSHGN